MTLNRNIQPPIFDIDKIENPIIEKISLKNKTKIHIVKGGSQDILKIDFVYNAGTFQQEKPVVASMTSAMLNEGSKKYSAFEIAESFDYRGAYINTSISNHKGIVSVICLTKDLDYLLEIVQDMILRPQFPKKEFDTIRENRKNSFITESEKTSTIARKHFLKNLFGINHSYANIVDSDDFDKLKIEDLVDFHSKNYSSESCNIVICGKVEDEHIDSIKKYFDIEYGCNNLREERKLSVDTNEKRKFFIKKEEAAQSSIRIGYISINKNHKDFVGLTVVNTILGGYFGSRLMSNIREDKGYTYGINSGLASLPKTGFFCIVTDVNNDIRDLAIQEIYKEIKILQEEKISETELQLVKNYMISELLRSLDGPFSVSDLVNQNLFFEIEEDYLQDSLDIIKNIKAEDIMYLSNKYLKIDNLIEVVVGA